MLTSEVAKFLGVSCASVRQFVYRKRLKIQRKINPRLNEFCPADVARFAERHGYPKKKISKRC